MNKRIGPLIEVLNGIKSPDGVVKIDVQTTGGRLWLNIAPDVRNYSRYIGKSGRVFKAIQLLLDLIASHDGMSGKLVVDSPGERMEIGRTAFNANRKWLDEGGNERIERIFTSLSQSVLPCPFAVICTNIGNETTVVRAKLERGVEDWLHECQTDVQSVQDAMSRIMMAWGKANGRSIEVELERSVSAPRHY
jgi:predicted RNA-binding protein YlqC (UPF0109 family)